MSDVPTTLRWEGGVEGRLVLLDQTRLPNEVVELHCHTVDAAWDAIKRLVVRGAPAIGVAAAYAVCLSLRASGEQPTSRRATPSGSAAGRGVHSSREAVAEAVTAPLPGPRGGPARGNDDSLATVISACEYLATSRPTAVNLFWALSRMRRVAEENAAAKPQALGERLLAEARAIHDEDRAMCDAMGRHGADLLADLPEGAGILTHCNAGALATGGDGSGLSPVFELARRGKRPQVWVDETRPLLQGARLTAWELMQRGIDCTLTCDSMAAHVMRSGKIQAVFVGADRIAANGDAANKIGTYGVAVLAEAHGIPLYVVAPTSTIDMTLATGAEIPIEERAAEEVTEGFGRRTAPAGVKVYNPAFDVTPYRLIKAIITERGVFTPK
jgi:methylthioribose-1-phosphate isomerase